MGKKFNFFKEAIATAKTSGTIAPSSRFLADRMLKGIDFESAELIIELGPGNGAITKHLLQRIGPNTTLICFEINENFYNELQKINNPQLIVLKESAENVKKQIQKLSFTESDYIVSSLPLSIIPKEISMSILKKSHEVLKEGGKYIQFQYSLNYLKKLKQVFGKKNISIQFEAINIPPAFVYQCTKN
ncbi:phospholipid N-methyltransferase [Tenacibaculum skagerrakense]|uniref:Phospholipid N-methyltransferase n=1 Tax=Tenacibaculum skagerrakense TaxID=186571 RepID=A0A4R2NQW3_9FLAO|nr:methyltransferase domain-containing protein [Tenacibaculum skagerrakense]TCP23851.1 phospholipid N-methyltransferase [Tenacibaculum skagerrakense]